MVTTVGLSSDFSTVIQDLIELEYDALAAYKVAVERFEYPINKQTFQTFIADHEKHIAQLKQYAQSRNLEVATEADAKAILTTGKIKMAALVGDRTILTAMASNEDDTVTAYERAFKHDNLDASAREFINDAWNDELRHRSWMQDAVKQSQDRVA